MAGRLAAPLAEMLDLLERQVVAGQVQQRVQQHGAVAGGQDKLIPVEPLGMAGVVFQEACPQ